MKIYHLVEKFASLITRNQKFANSSLEVFAAGLFDALDDNSDSLKTELESFLDKKISLEDYERWKNINQSLLNNLTTRSWFDFYPNCISFAEDESNRWIITQNLKELKDYYENPEASQDLNIKKSSLLQGVANIPNLYLVFGNLEDSFIISEPEQESADLAHNFFITQTLKNFFEDISTQEIDQFIKTNRPTIDKLKSSFQEVPTMLGKGTDGVAFSIGPNLVLKFFRTTLSYQKAREAQERLWKNPGAARTEAMIYDVGILGTIEEKPVYYYIIQKMRPIRDLSPSNAYVTDAGFVTDAESTIKSIIRLVSEYFIDNENDVFIPLKESFQKNPNMQQLNETIKSIARGLALEIFDHLGESDIKDVRDTIKDTFNVELRDDWLSRLVEEIIMKYLTDRADLHVGNLGVTPDGYLRYFDPAHPSMPTAQDYLEYFEAEPLSAS